MLVNLRQTLLNGHSIRLQGRASAASQDLVVAQAVPYQGGFDVNSVTGFYSGGLIPEGAANKPNEYRCFQASAATAFAPLVYGFYSDINAGNVSGPDASLNYAIYCGGTAESYFEGLTEHAGGVRLTGGSSGTVNRGIYYSAGKVRIVQQSEADGDSFTACASYPTFGHNVDSVVGFEALPPGRNPTTVFTEEYKAFSVPETTQGILTSTGTIYGFHSNLAGSGNKKYNFYAEGSAPNYFAGTVRTGAVTATGTNTGDDANHTWTDQSTASNAVRITNSAGFISRFGTTANSSCFHLNRLGSSTGSFLQFREDGVEVDSIRLDGSGGITYGVSDYRLKENIVDLPSATDAVKSLRPVNYNFKSHPAKTRPGFIAHELQETLPVAVVGEKDETEAIGTLLDWDGTELETEVIEPSAEELTYTEEVETDGVATTVTRTRTWTATGTLPVYQSIDQTKLIPLLTKALQEALTEIDSLKTRISALES